MESILRAYGVMLKNLEKTKDKATKKDKVFLCAWRSVFLVLNKLKSKLGNAKNLGLPQTIRGRRPLIAPKKAKRRKKKKIKKINKKRKKGTSGAGGNSFPLPPLSFSCTITFVGLVL